MLKKTIKVSEEVWRRLMNIKRWLSFVEGEDFSLSETIEWILDHIPPSVFGEDKDEDTG